MKFFRNNWYWILGIVIGVGLSCIILIQRNQQWTSETGNVVPDLFTQTESSEVLSPENGSLRSHQRIIRTNLSPGNEHHGYAPKPLI